MSARPFTGIVEALPADEAAGRCGLGVVAFRNRVRDGKIPGPILIGDLERWLPADLEDFRWKAEPGVSLYLVGTNEGDFVKIGITKNLRQRVDRMQTDNPFELVPVLLLPGSRWLEGRFHVALRSDHVRGEWFRVGSWFDEVSAWGCRADRDTVFKWLEARNA